MNPIEYITGHVDDWPIVLAILTVSALFHYPAIKRTVRTAFDPLFLVMVGDVFATTVVAFMYLSSDIGLHHLLFFAASQLTLYAGYAAGRACMTRRARPTPLRVSGRHFAGCVFLVTSTVNVMSTLAVWNLAGIPLFRVSRLGAFVGSGGFGVLERLASASSGMALFAGLYLLLAVKVPPPRAWVYLFAVWLLGSTALSGSRSAFIGLLFWVFAYLWLYGGNPALRTRFWGGRLGGAMLGISVLFALAVIAVQGGSGWLEAVAGLAIRLLSFGDVYIYAYPGDLIDQLQGSNPFVGLFGGFLSTFRLFPVEALYTPIGLQFTEMIFPGLDYFAGPNPRHNVMAYHYFGWLGLGVSFVIGFIVMQVQRSAYAPTSLRFSSTLLRVTIYMSIAGLSVDVEYALSTLANTMLMYFLILLGAMMLEAGRPPARSHA